MAANINPLDYIFQEFKYPKKTNNQNQKIYVIDLYSISNYLKKLRMEQQNVSFNVFQKKLNRIIESNKEGIFEFQKQQFISLFTSKNKQQQFQDIFGSIDINNGQDISKQQVKQLVRKLSLPYSQRDINLMIEVISVDGDKVTKQNLKKFLL